MNRVECAECRSVFGSRNLWYARCQCGALCRIDPKADAIEQEDTPYVCPGCHAVGGEPCAPGCIDDEIRRRQEEPNDYDGFPNYFDEDT